MLVQVTLKLFMMTATDSKEKALVGFHLNEFVSKVTCFMALQMKYLTTASVTDLKAGFSRVH